MTGGAEPPAVPAEVLRAQLTERPLDVAAHAEAVQRSASGALVTFAGVVRNHDHGRDVVAIEYVAHPSAAVELARAVQDVAADGGAQAVAVSHRIGTLQVGEAALVVAVCAVHRAEAFAVAAAMVDEVKRRLPVWKRQVFLDGTDEWVACP